VLVEGCTGGGVTIVSRRENAQTEKLILVGVLVYHVNGGLSGCQKFFLNFSMKVTDEFISKFCATCL
jgi:hypothetical protein